MKTNYDDIDVKQEVRLAIIEKQITSFRSVAKWVIITIVSPIVLYALNWGLDRAIEVGNVANACQLVPC